MKLKFKYKNEIKVWNKNEKELNKIKWTKKMNYEIQMKLEQNTKINNKNKYNK